VQELIELERLQPPADLGIVGGLGHLEELVAPGGRVLAARLHGVAIRAQRNHVAGVVVSAPGEVFDVVDVEDGLALPVRLCGHSCAVGALARPATTNEHGSSRGRTSCVVCTDNA
jgi:hypothetical protein